MKNEKISELMGLGLSKKAAHEAWLHDVDVSLGENGLIYLTVASKAYDGMTIDEANAKLENWN